MKNVHTYGAGGSGESAAASQIHYGTAKTTACMLVGFAMSCAFGLVSEDKLLALFAISGAFGLGLAEMRREGTKCLLEDWAVLGCMSACMMRVAFTF